MLILFSGRINFSNAIGGGGGWEYSRNRGDNSGNVQYTGLVTIYIECIGDYGMGDSCSGKWQ